MNQKRTILGIIIGLPILLIGLFFINSAVYPFTSKDPNFADVEAAFSKLQFPSDWQEIKSTENRGIAGRQCYQFNSSGCFHKSKTFKVSTDVSLDEVEGFFKSSGCQTVSRSDATQEGESKMTTNLRCDIGKLELSGTYRGPESEVYISLSTR